MANWKEDSSVKDDEMEGDADVAAARVIVVGGMVVAAVMV